jgi:thioredoxin reductase (NADPH)
LRRATAYRTAGSTLEQDPTAQRLLRALGIGPEETPVVILRGSEIVRNPSN